MIPIELKPTVTDNTFDLFIQKLRGANEVVVDVETDGLNAWKGNRLCGVGVAFNSEEGYYLPFRHPADNLPMERLSELWDALSGVKVVAGYNLKFDLAFLYVDGYNAPADQELADIIVAARLCSSLRYPDLSLSGQLEEHFGAEARQYDDEFKEFLKKNKWDKTFHMAPVDVISKYCVGDVCSEWKLLEYLMPIIEETNQTGVWDQEKKVTSTLWKMERVGLGYDKAYGEDCIPKLKARIGNLTNEIYALAGTEFNLGSGPQLTKVMNSFDIHSPKTSPKTGKELWPVGVLLGIEHPICGKLLEVRSLDKVLGTYFEPILEWPESTVHCNHKNWGTVTGRMSCTNPNLQNIAKNVQNLQGNATDDATMEAMSAFLGAHGSEFTDMTSASGARVGGVTLGGMRAVASTYEESGYDVSVRRLFIGRPGYRLYMLDYSQMEMRVFADYVQDDNLHGLLESSDFDFHSHVAKTVWSVDEDAALWNFYRTLAKAVNFGLIYGIGIKKLASQIKATVEEAKKYKKDYFDRFPKARLFIDQVTETLERRRYIFNRYKRRYWVDPSKAYVGVNYLVQGTSADIVKNRMVACQNFVEENNLKSRMLTQVHDELLFEVHESEESWLPWKFQEIMEEKQINTFLPVDVSRGNPSWANKQKYSTKENAWVEDS